MKETTAQKRLSEDQKIQIPYYYDKGFTKDQIARHYQVTVVTITTYIKKSGLFAKSVSSKTLLSKYKKWK